MFYHRPLQLLHIFTVLVLGKAALSKESVKCLYRITFDKLHRQENALNVIGIIIDAACAGGIKVNGLVCCDYLGVGEIVVQLALIRPTFYRKLYVCGRGAGALSAFNAGKRNGCINLIRNRSIYRQGCYRDSRDDKGQHKQP